MVVCLLTCLLVSNALLLKQEKSILFFRMTLTGLSLAVLLSYNNLHTSSLSKGIGIYGGLFNITTFTQWFNIFTLIISGLILILIAFYPRKALIEKYFPLFDIILSYVRTFFVNYLPNIFKFILIRSKEILNNSSTYVHLSFILLFNLITKVFYKFSLEVLGCIWLYPIFVFIITYLTIMVVSDLWNYKPSLFWRLIFCLFTSILYVVLISYDIPFSFLLELCGILIILASPFSLYFEGVLHMNSGNPWPNNGNYNNFGSSHNNNNLPPQWPNHFGNNYYPQDRSDRDNSKSLIHLLSPNAWDRHLPPLQAGPGNNLSNNGSLESKTATSITTGMEIANPAKRNLWGVTGKPDRTSMMVLPSMRDVPEAFVPNNRLGFERARWYSPALTVSTDIVCPDGRRGVNAVNRLTCGYYDGEVIKHRADRLIELYVVVIDNVDDMVMGRNTPTLSKEQLAEIKHDVGLLREGLRRLPFHDGQGPFTANSFTKNEKDLVLAHMNVQMYVIEQRIDGDTWYPQIKRHFFRRRWDSPYLQSSMKKDD